MSALLGIDFGGTGTPSRRRGGVARILAQASGIMINLVNLEACIIGAAAMAAGRIGSP
jgi:hypothetical protein